MEVMARGSLSVTTEATIWRETGWVEKGRASLLELEKGYQHLMSKGLLRSLLKSLHISFYLCSCATSP